MKTFVVFSMGTKLKETEQSMSFLVEANSLEEAKKKVCNDPDAFGESPDDALDGYGHEWFLQELNPDYTAAQGNQR